MGPYKESEMSNGMLLSSRRVYEIQILFLLHLLVHMSSDSFIITQAFSEAGIVLGPMAKTNPAVKILKAGKGMWWWETYCVSPFSRQRKTVMLLERATDVYLGLWRWQSEEGNMSIQLEGQCVQGGWSKVRVGCKIRRG